MNFSQKHVEDSLGILGPTIRLYSVLLFKFVLVTIIFLLGLFVTSLDISAQTLSSPRYMIEILGNHQGLNSSDISALYQDKDGFIWVGTKPGVSRFDSYDFQNFTKAGEQYLGQIHSITEDAAGTLWIGGENGLFYYEAGQFFAASLDPYVIRSLHLGKSNELWVVGLGFVPFFLSDKELSQLKQGESVQPKPIVSEKEWRSKISSLRVWAIDTDDQGDAWLGLDNQRVSFDGDQLNIHWSDTTIRHEYSAIAAFHQDSAYWGSEETGLIFQKNGDFTKLKVPPTYIIAVTDSTTYFLTTMELVALNSNGQWDTLHTFDRYAKLYFKTMILDREGNFWIGSASNLLKLTPSYFHSWSASDHSLLHSNYSIAERRSGEILIGSSKKNILQFENNDFTLFEQINPPHNSFTSAMHTDKRGWIWYGTSMGGLIVNKNGVHETYNTTEGLGDKGQYLFYQDCAGGLWSGGERGITNIEVSENGELSFKNYLVPFQDKGLPIFQSVAESPGGSIWTAGDKGLFTIKEDALVEWLFPTPANPNPIITAAAVDSQGQLWLSTQGEGLWQCQFNEKDEPQLIKQWTVKDGLLNDVLLSIHIDQENRIWAVSQGGICRLALPRGEYSIRCYDEQDGWLNEASSRYQLLESMDSMLWGVSATGVVAFPLYTLPLNEVQPKSFITQIELFDGKEDIYRFAKNDAGSLQLPQQLVLPYNKNFLRFHFTTTSHTQAGKNRFRYQLEGLDSGWRENDQTRNIPYPGLQPGSYIFKVQTANNDGIWEDGMASYAFEINYPWYQTWIAYTLLLVTLSFLVIYVYRFRLNRKLEQQETLRLKELDAFKTRFYSNITHEFRTPLTVIQGMVDELEKQPQKQPQKKLNLIKKHSQQLLMLVNQILDLSKLKAGNLTTELQQDDIIAFLKYLTESHESFAGLKNIVLQFYSEQQQLMMDFDPKQLELVLNNLVSNAIKFTPEYGKILIVAKEVTFSNQPVLEVQVRDNGIGITAEQLPYIYDRFHQAKPSHENQGSGIGLALVKELVEFMKGSIRVESEPGQGTTFFLRFPIQNNALLVTTKEQDKNISAPISERLATEAPPVSNKSLPILLIIEDNVDVTYYLKTCLEEQYQILTSTNGKDGIEKALAVLPDIIISDVMMPKMNGFEVCSTLKKDERTNHIPIILLTAKATSQDKLMGLTYGADAYLIKPFEKAELMIRLQKLREIRQTLQEKYRSSLLNNQQQDSSHRTPIDTFMKKIEEATIMGYHDEGFSVNELARAVNFSRAHVHRKIKTITGMSTAIYIRMVRLQKAKKMLQTTDATISEIAYEVGFKSPTYFSQVFKDKFGKSPSEFRS